MTAQAKPPFEGEDNTSVPVADNQYDEEETFESVLGKWSLLNSEPYWFKIYCYEHISELVTSRPVTQGWSDSTVSYKAIMNVCRR